MKLIVLPPNINQSKYQFVVEDGKIVYGLGAIKGVGQAAIERIEKSREEGGIFIDLDDFCQRIDLRKVNKRVLEALIKSGSMDDLGGHRAEQLESISDIVMAAEQKVRNNSFGQADLFGNISGISLSDKQVNVWPDKERLKAEKETLGLYLSGHPIKQYENELQYIVSGKIGNLKLQPDKIITIAGMVSTLRLMNTRRGDRMAFIRLSDRSGSMEVAVFSDVYRENSSLLKKDQLLIIEGEVSVDDFTGDYKVRAKKVFDVCHARETYAKYLLIKCDDKSENKNFSSNLTKILQPYRGGLCPVFVDYRKNDTKAFIPLGNDWFVTPEDELIDKLREYFSSVEVCYE